MIATTALVKSSGTGAPLRELERSFRRHYEHVAVGEHEYLVRLHSGPALVTERATSLRVDVVVRDAAAEKAFQRSFADELDGRLGGHGLHVAWSRGDAVPVSLR